MRTAVAITLACLLVGCGGHIARTETARAALDRNAPREALSALNEELDVKRGDEMPKDIEGNNALVVLDRAMVHQSLGDYKNSQRDFQAADKAIDLLDLSHATADDIGKYIFSDSVGRYRAPPYEKYLINTLNIINYLELSDLEGARVEARRLGVMNRYYYERMKERASEHPAALSLGAYLAGFALEHSGDLEEAMHWYDRALAFDGAKMLAGVAIARLARSGATYRSKRIEKALSEISLPDHEAECDVLLIEGYGRIPHKEAVHLPIGLALTRAALLITPADRSMALGLAARGLVTWVNFPTLVSAVGTYEAPHIGWEASSPTADVEFNLESDARAEWRRVEDAAIASAITRAIVRMAVGEGAGAAAQGAAGRKAEGVGLLVSLITQASLAVADTPDTRSWDVMPARVAMKRLRVPAGEYQVTLSARGAERRERIVLPAGGFRVVSLFALR